MNRTNAEELFEEVQKIFERYGARAIPSGWSLSGQGIFFFEFHVRQRLFDSKRIPGKIFQEIRNMLKERGMDVAGSGMGFIGNRWWFYHFHFLKDPNIKDETGFM